MPVTVKPAGRKVRRGPARMRSGSGAWGTVREPVEPFGDLARVLTVDRVRGVGPHIHRALGQGGAGPFRPSGRRVASSRRERTPVFFFYNSRWGCLMSLLVSVALSLLLMYLLGWI